jgi:hypothetical protein
MAVAFLDGWKNRWKATALHCKKQKRTDERNKRKNSEPDLK